MPLHAGAEDERRRDEELSRLARRGRAARGRLDATTCGCVQLLARLPDAARARLGARLERAQKRRLRDAGSLYVLGRGLGLCIAQESALKFKETCGTACRGHLSARRCGTGRWRWCEPASRCSSMAQDDETRPGVEAAGRRSRRDVDRCSPWPDSSCAGALELPTIAAHPAHRTVAARIQSFYRLANAVSPSRAASIPTVPRICARSPRRSDAAGARQRPRCSPTPGSSRTARVLIDDGRIAGVLPPAMLRVRAAPSRSISRGRLLLPGFHRHAGERRRRRAVQRRARRSTRYARSAARIGASARLASCPP